MSLPNPTTLGLDAAEWLAAVGLLPHTPHTRSSDYESILTCPRTYYIRRRLGLVPLRYYSEALNRGSWFHLRAERADLEPDEAHVVLRQDLSTRVAELKTFLPAAGIMGDLLADAVALEEKDFHTACAWYDAYRTIPVKDHMTFEQIIGRFEVLGREVKLTDSSTFPPRTILIDLLLYDGKDGIYLVDFKTTGDPAQLRAQTCPIEFQTLHYLNVTNDLLQSGELGQLFPRIKPGSRLAGMIHFIFQKPTISLSMQDRPFYYAAEGKRSGVSGMLTPQRDHWDLKVVGPGTSVRRETFPNLTAEVEGLALLHDETGKKPSKVFTATDPDPVLYHRRCARWMKGVGEYSDKQPEREANPVVNYSLTSGSVLTDPLYSTQYQEMLSMVTRFARLEATPLNFPVSASACRPFGKLSTYAPFHLSPVTSWPEIIQRERFVIDHRD